VLVMNGWDYGADIATMATGLSALTAAGVWTAGRWRAWRNQAAEKKHHVWNTGYIMNGLIQSWFVRLAADDAPDGRTGRVVLEVLREAGGESDPQMVDTFRAQVRTGGRLVMPPTAEQEAFLKELERARRHKGFPVR
jgi:hypothetical protein